MEIVLDKRQRFRLYWMNTDELADPEIFAQCYESMSHERREKIDRIKSQNDKALSLAAGLLLDRGLQEYGLRESGIRIETGAHGKPFLADYPDICFNLSHSGHMAMAAFADTSIGCDLEYPAKKVGRLAERFFCTEECSWIMESPHEEVRRERFFRLWTLKESFLKATGTGLSVSLNSFCVRIGKSGPELLYCDCAGGYRFAEYRLQGYCAAVCIQE